MHLKGNSYTLPFLWNSVGTFSSAVNHTTCIFKVSKHRHAGVKFMKKYFTQLYGNCDLQRCWSDLKLVLTFGTPTGFQISAGDAATLGSLRCSVPWSLIAGWAGGVGARHVDVGSPCHTQKENTGKVNESLKNIAWLCWAQEQKVNSFHTEGKSFSVYSSQGLVVK